MMRMAPPGRDIQGDASIWTQKSQAEMSPFTKPPGAFRCLFSYKNIFREAEEVERHLLAGWSHSLTLT